MIKKVEIKKLFYLSRKILKKRLNVNNLGNNFLFLPSAHPSHLSKYRHVNSLNINYLFFLRYFFEFLVNLTKIIVFTLKVIFSKNYININKRKKKKIIIVSHLTNIKNFKKNIDTQYFGIEKEFGRKDSIFFFLDHIKTSNKQKLNLLNFKKNIFLNNDFIEYPVYQKIIKNIFNELLFLLKSINKINNNFEKKFYLECAKYLFSVSTIKNIIIYYNIEKLIVAKKVTNILITHEGHGFEYLIFLLAKIHKIRVFGYQPSYITNDHYSMFLNLGKNFLPTKILANGKISYDFLKKKFNSKNVILLGSNKYRKKIKTRKIDKFNLLVLPSYFDGEASEFLEFCYRFFKKNENLKANLIFRLHPQINKSNFIKENSEFLKNKDRIKISNSSLINDILSCKYVIYRSSSAVIDAMQQGLIPIFFKGKKNNFQSDPLWQLKSKIIIKDTKELADIFKNKKYLKKKKKLNYLNFANDYYRPLNHKKLKKIF